jgi:hypothetical protein
MARSPYYALLDTLEDRFLLNLRRHPGIFWGQVSTRLAARPEKLAVLLAMEETGGEPDVVDAFPDTEEFVFCDCSAETPPARQTLAYDAAAQDAAAIGAQLLTESQYRELQELGDFDAQTSTWLQTPPEVRTPGQALFGHRRYGHVFVYHDAPHHPRSYRAWLKV